MPSKIKRTISDGAAKYLRWTVLQGIKRLYKDYDIAITAPRFGKPWSRMNPAELQMALEYVASLFGQSPHGSDWNDMDFSPRIVGCICDGSLWTVTIGFFDKTTALAFSNSARVQESCALATQPRTQPKKGRGKRTGYPFEVKLWVPDTTFLIKLAERESRQSAN